MAAGLFYRTIRPGLCLDNYSGFEADQPPSGHEDNLDTVITGTPRDDQTLRSRTTSLSMQHPRALR